MRDPVYRSAERLVKWMTVLLFVEAVLCLMALWSDSAALDSIRAITERRADVGTGESWVDAYVTPGGSVILILKTPVTFALIVLFCNWIPSSNRNARALGATGMRFTPGWSVGWYFVPVMNLFKPYQAMKEIWMASVPSDATPWQQRAPSPLLGWWWALWLVSGATGLLAFWLRWIARDWDNLLLEAWAHLYSDALDIPLAIVAMLLVRGIHRMQERSRYTTAFE